MGKLVVLLTKENHIYLHKCVMDIAESRDFKTRGLMKLVVNDLIEKVRGVE